MARIAEADAASLGPASADADAAWTSLEDNLALFDEAVGVEPGENATAGAVREGWLRKWPAPGRLGRRRRRYFRLEGGEVRVSVCVCVCVRANRVQARVRVIFCMRVGVQVSVCVRVC